MSTIERIGFIGDLHSGSLTAPWPLEWLPGDSPYSGSRYLVECLDHLAASWPTLDLLIFTGDLIEGKARKQDGVGLFTAQLGKQVEGAIELLTPLVNKAKRVLRVTGTDYHDDAHNPLLALDKALGVERTAQVFNIKLAGGALLNVAHHPAGGQVMYSGTKLDREILWSIIQSSLRKIPAATHIVRGHLHEFSVFRRKGRTMCLLPCFKLADGYAVKMDYERFQPDLGAVLLVRDETDASGWRFRETIYDNPLEEVLDYAEPASRTQARASKRSRA